MSDGQQRWEVKTNSKEVFLVRRQKTDQAKQEKVLERPVLRMNMHGVCELSAYNALHSS
jgi:hypothetical protein